MISRQGVRPDPQKLKTLIEITLKTKEEFQAFLIITSYVSKLSPSTADICESLGKLSSARPEWTWNTTYQKMFDKAKSIVKDVCMKFNDKTKPLYLEMDATEVGLGAALLQTRSGTSCPREEAPDNRIL